MPEWFPFKPHVRLRRWQGTPMGYCIYAALWDHAFDRGGLDDNPKLVAQLLGLDVRLVREVWPAFKAVCVVQDNGRLMPQEIVDADYRIEAKRQKRIDAGKVGGHRSGEVRRAKKDPQCLPPDLEFPDGNEDRAAQIDAIQRAAKEVEEEVSKACAAPEGALATALEELFPAEMSSQSKFLELARLVLKVNGCPKDVLAWPGWMRVRYPNRALTVYTFRDFFPQMIKESKTLGTGARFILAVWKNVDATKPDLLARLTQADINVATTQGELLDEMVGLATSTEWRAHRYTTGNFLTYWRGLYDRKDFPLPESIVKHWGGFAEAVAEANEANKENST